MIRVLKQRLCVRPEPTERTPGGIIIPGTHAPDTNRARVVAAGPEAQCKAGDRVIISHWAHTEIDDETCHRLGEAPGLRFLHEDSVCMRNDGDGWQPLRGRVLVRLDAQVGSIGMFVLPEACRDQPTTGEVVLAGEGVDSKPGERVLTGKWNGVQLEPETVLELGYEQDAQLFCMRETHEQEIGTIRGRKVYAPADEVYGIVAGDQ